MTISHHPASIETAITCTCGATVHTRSTVPNMRVAVCANCHPFFTGRLKMVDTAGRVEAFRKKFSNPAIDLRQQRAGLVVPTLVQS